MSGSVKAVPPVCPDVPTSCKVSVLVTKVLLTVNIVIVSVEVDVLVSVTVAESLMISEFNDTLLTLFNVSDDEAEILISSQKSGVPFGDQLVAVTRS